MDDLVSTGFTTAERERYVMPTNVWLASEVQPPGAANPDVFWVTVDTPIAVIATNQMKLTKSSFPVAIQGSLAGDSKWKDKIVVSRDLYSPQPSFISGSYCVFTRTLSPNGVSLHIINNGYVSDSGFSCDTATTFGHVTFRFLFTQTNFRYPQQVHKSDLRYLQRRKCTLAR